MSSLLSAASVSVIIPTYNHGRFIGEAIRSILGQTCPAGEIIVVDDGSTDETGSFLTEFGDKVQYIRQENRGVCAARNMGATHASGNYFAFADADDVWMPEKLEKQMLKFAEDDELGLVHCGMREFDTETGSTLSVDLIGGEGWVADDILLWEKSVIVGPGATIVVKREAFECVGGFDTEMKVGEDCDFCYRVARRFRVGFVPEVLMDYRSHPANAHKDVAEMERGMARFYKKAFLSADANTLKLQRRSYGNFHKVMAGSYFYSRQYSAFIRHAVLSLWSRPSNFGYFAAFPLRRLLKG